MTPPSGPDRDLSPDPGAARAAAPVAPPRQRWRLFLAVPASAGPGGVVGSAAARTWPAVLATAGLPVAGEGVGRVRAVPAAQLPVGVAGEREVVDLYLVERLPVAVVRAALEAVLPDGATLVGLQDVWVGAPSAPAAVVAADYRVLLAGPPRWVVEGAVLALLGAETLPRERRREKKAATYDLRPLILDLEVRGSDASGVTLAIRLRHLPDAAGRPDEVVAALGEHPAPPFAVPAAVRSIVRERLVLADDPDAPAAR